ncbi:unnamed protein product [Amoebophrya sp. A120]|nr:unnamed protein product [Amoebophrya sp. A120]|eukprot:GSA120T00020292001.1
MEAVAHEGRGPVCRLRRPARACVARLFVAARPEVLECALTQLRPVNDVAPPPRTSRRGLGPSWIVERVLDVAPPRLVELVAGNSGRAGSSSSPAARRAKEEDGVDYPWLVRTEVRDRAKKLSRDATALELDDGRGLPPQVEAAQKFRLPVQKFMDRGSSPRRSSAAACRTGRGDWRNRARWFVLQSMGVGCYLHKSTCAVK